MTKIDPPGMANATNNKQRESQHAIVQKQRVLRNRVKPKTITFHAGNCGAGNKQTVAGFITTVRLKGLPRDVRLFFTADHRDLWLVGAEPKREHLGELRDQVQARRVEQRRDHLHHRFQHSQVSLAGLRGNGERVFTCQLVAANEASPSSR